MALPTFANSKNLYTMAKQRGIHQIKGKINNLCYYEQKYIRGGLIRRINEAMSERLKTDPVFENTRHYNAIFGACSNYAKCFLSVIGNRRTFLFLPYRQAILTRYLFDYKSRNVSGVGYPEIGFSLASDRPWVYLIDNLMKNKLSSIFPSLNRVYDNLVIESTLSITIPGDELEAYCLRYNVKSLVLSHSSPLYFYPIGFNINDQRYTTPDYNNFSRPVVYNWSTGDGDLEIELSTGTVDDTFTFWIIYVSPVLYQVGGRNVTGSTGATCGIIQFFAS